MGFVSPEHRHREFFERNRSCCRPSAQRIKAQSARLPAHQAAGASNQTRLARLRVARPPAVMPARRKHKQVLLRASAPRRRAARPTRGARAKTRRRRGSAKRRALASAAAPRTLMQHMQHRWRQRRQLQWLRRSRSSPRWKLQMHRRQHMQHMQHRQQMK